MDKEIKAIIIVVALVACTFILFVSIITIKNYKTEKLYITHGYEQVMVKGSASYLWQKKK